MPQSFFINAEIIVIYFAYPTNLQPTANLFSYLRPHEEWNRISWKCVNGLAFQLEARNHFAYRTFVPANWKTNWGIIISMVHQLACVTRYQQQRPQNWFVICHCRNFSLNYWCDGWNAQCCLNSVVDSIDFSHTDASCKCTSLRSGRLINFN